MGRVGRQQRGQAALELSLVIPVLFLAIGGVVDVGRAYYYKIAVSNAAREAAHWATLSDPLTRQPPSDEQIGIDVTQPSQESFGLGMSLAPLCSQGTQQDNCGTTPVRHGSPPITGSLIDTQMDTPLQPGNSWLFIYPAQAGRTALRPPSSEVAWRVVDQRTQLVSAPDPAHGGVAAALRAAGQGFLPINAEAASGSCYSFGPPTVTPAAASVVPGGDLSFAVTVPVTGDGRPPANSVQLLISGVTPSFNGTYSQLWSPANGNNSAQANLTLGAGTSYNVYANLTLHIGANTVPNTYTFTVTASSSGGGCTPANEPGTFSVTVAAVGVPPGGAVPDDFSVVDNPSIIGTTPGNSATTTISVQSIGAFTADVTVTESAPTDASGSPAAGVVATPSTTVVPGGNGSFQLTFTTDSALTQPGAYQVTVTGQSSSPAESHSVNLELDVGQPGAPPTAGSSAPKAHQIICTVVYYYTPIAPALGILLPNSRLYIISAATLEATY